MVNMHILGFLYTFRLQIDIKDIKNKSKLEAISVAKQNKINGCK